MARYPAKHKAATRARIITAAAERFKRDGIDGAGITGVMQDAGLTLGAFSSHFASKDDLVAAVLTQEMQEQVDIYQAAPQGVDGVETMIDHYLTAQHVAARAGGCPVAALIGDTVRAAPAGRNALEHGMEAIVDQITQRLPGKDADRPTATAVYALLIGTLQAARLASDPGQVDAILASGRTAAQALVRGLPL